MPRTDNTYVRKPMVIEPVDIGYKPREDRIYDLDKANVHRDMQDLYNSSFLGAGIAGKQTRHDYTTEEGQEKIRANLDYMRNNLLILSTALLASGAGSSLKGIIPKGKTIGSIRDFEPFKIAEGAESMVFRNSPFSVGKISWNEDMALRNGIPNSLKVKPMGKTTEGLRAFRQRKVRMSKNYDKDIKELDRRMERKGFRKVNDDKIQYRAYTNGKVVVDDVSPDNLGVDFLGKPKMIDFNLQSVADWIRQGFKL